MAPPSKLTPDVQDRICTLIRAGNTNDIAAAGAGVSLRSFYNWREKKPAFAAAVARAEADAEAIMVARIAKAAAAGSWRAAGWMLERRHPERWAAVKDRDSAPVAEGPDGFARLYDVSNPGRVRTRKQQ